MDEIEGANAIIELQKLAGFTTSKEVAEEDWKRFTKYEKKQTALAYKLMVEGRPQ